MEARRADRIPCKDDIRLAWSDRNGSPKYARGKCINVSEFGAKIELSEPVEVRSFVQLQSDKLKLAGAAAVRHCERYYGKYLIGLEFAGGLKCAHLPSTGAE